MNDYRSFVIFFKSFNASYEVNDLEYDLYRLLVTFMFEIITKKNQTQENVASGSEADSSWKKR